MVGHLEHLGLRKQSGFRAHRVHRLLGIPGKQHVKIAVSHMKDQAGLVLLGRYVVLGGPDYIDGRLADTKRVTAREEMCLSKHRFIVRNLHDRTAVDPSRGDNSPERIDPAIVIVVSVRDHHGIQPPHSSTC